MSPEMKPEMKPIPFIDLARQQNRIRDAVDSRIKTVLDHGQYIMGPEVAELERALMAHSGAGHVVSCSSGTDALMLGLMALGLKPGDAVIVPSFTFAASAEVLPCLGAMPVFAEIDPQTFNLDPARLGDALKAARDTGLNCVGVITVGLFGQPADMDRITAFAEAEGLWLLDDAAQSYGAAWQGRKVGTLAPITATSFFPAKPLGCYGDGGAVFTDDEDMAAIMRSARVHGMGRERYSHDRIGMTARLDTIQAAVLLEKLTIFDEELTLRQQVADRYAAHLGGHVTTPQLAPGATSSWAQYCITLAAGSDREAIRSQLMEKGIPTAIYYPKGMHEQAPYQHFPVATGGLDITADACDRVLALPFHPYLEAAQQDQVIAAVIEAVTA